jgi:predicted nucleotidyltransferase
MECREQLYREKYGEELPFGSNDLLGLAYLAAIRSRETALRAATCLRTGQAYNDDSTPNAGRYPSASALRALWKKSSVESLRRHLPSPAVSVLEEAVTHGVAPLSIDKLEAAILTYFRTAQPNALAQCAELGGGLAERFIEAARKATDLASLYAAAATRRYTNARIRRALFYGLCGVRESDLRTPPAYTRLLAASPVGCAYLAAIRKDCTLPVLTKPSDIPGNDRAIRQRMIEEILEAYVTLAYPTSQQAGYLLRQRPWIGR